jgi:hypothetical protein
MKLTHWIRRKFTSRRGRAMLLRLESRPRRNSWSKRWIKTLIMFRWSRAKVVLRRMSWGFKEPRQLLQRRWIMVSWPNHRWRKLRKCKPRSERTYVSSSSSLLTRRSPWASTTRCTVLIHRFPRESILRLLWHTICMAIRLLAGISLISQIMARACHRIASVFKIPETTTVRRGRSPTCRAIVGERRRGKPSKHSF